MTPNCIFIVADHLRYDVIGKGFTPHIDKLIGDSVECSNAYCASPLCVPARGSLFTGTYPGVNGSVINGWFKPEKEYSKVKEGIDNLYDLMEQQGMECIHSGKQHLFVEGVQLEQREGTGTRWLTTEKSYKEFLEKNGKRFPGGKRFRTPVPEMSGGKYTRIVNYSNASTGVYEEGSRYYCDEYFTEQALLALREYNGENPLFLSMMYLAPHPPFDIPEPWYSKVRPEEVELPQNVGEWYKNQSPLQKYNITGVVGNSYNLEQWKETFRVYLGLVAFLDDCVGRIIEALIQKDIYDNSIIVFSSDHGEMLGSHCLFQKMCMYEESVKTPLSIHLPWGENAGLKIEDYISHIDILPTLCEFYGIKTKHSMNGRSLKTRILEGTPMEGHPVFIQYDGNGSRGNYQRCIIWKNHKLIVDIFKDEVYFELYDLEHDRLETSNLLFEGRSGRLAEEMCQMLLGHMEKIQDPIRFLALDVEEFVNIYREL